MINTKIYGNHSLCAMLTCQVNEGNFCHAYLLYGESGIGKQTLAQYVARCALCSGETKPCGTCSSCHKLSTDSHPDLYVHSSKSVKSTILVDEIRAIRKDAYIKPNESERKVYIIPNAENMNAAAANALLKVLEEPPKSAMFILTTSAKEAVLPTVLSRCIPLGLHPLSYDECKSAITELRPEAPPDMVQNALAKSSGVLGTALNIVDGGNDTHGISDRVIKGIVAYDEYTVLTALTSIKTDRILFKNVVDELMAEIRGALLVKYGVIKGDGLLNFPITANKAQRLIAALQRATELNDGNVLVSLLTGWLSSQLMQE